MKTVLISKGFTASGVKPQLEARWDVSRDRRTVWVVDYRPDDSLISWLLRPFGFYTTTVCDFDSSGRFVRSRLKLNGLTTFMTTEVRYDAQGREVEAKSWSTDGGANNVATYEYLGNTVTERSLRTPPVTAIIEREAEGRITREIRKDPRLPVSDLEHRYGPDVVETINHANGKTDNWWTTRSDSMGNPVELMSPMSGRTTWRYEYDASGNWTHCVTDRTGETTGAHISEVELRGFSYFP